MTTHDNIQVQNVAKPGSGTELPSETLGTVFQRARNAKELAQKDVAHRLRMNVSVIQSIESDQLESLGAPVFVRMYLLRYAQLLGLPEKTILKRYKALGIDEPPPLKIAHPVNTHSESTSLRWLAYPLVLGLVAWFGWLGLERISDHFELPGTSSVATNAEETTTDAVEPSVNELASANIVNIDRSDVAAAALSAEPISNSDSGVLSSTDARADEVSSIITAEQMLLAGQNPENSSAENPAEVNDNTVVQDADNTIDKPASETFTVQTDANNAITIVALADGQASDQKLSMKFKKDCWVEVQDADGQRLAYGIVKANDVQTWSGVAPFSITLGNAQAAEIKLNDELVNRSLYVPERGTVSRFVLELPQQG